MLWPVDQPTVELMVRLTARLSAASFAAALIVFAAGYPHHRQRERFATRLFAGFIVAHTIHFGTVGWLAVVTANENIQERGGWTAVASVAVLFYAAAFVVLRGWNVPMSERSPSRRPRVMTNVAVVAIAVAFLNSYLARAVVMPIYWLPVAGLTGTVALYLAALRTGMSSDAAATPKRATDS
jgi:hypothetical protein